MSVLIYTENTDGKFKKSAFEAVSYARAIADKNNTQLTAISIGEVNANELAKLAEYGADKILNTNNANLKSFINQAYASVIAEAAKKTGANIIILANTLAGRGLAARLGAKLQAGVAEGAVALPDQSDNKFIVKKTTFSGKAFALVELTSAIKIISLTANIYPAVSNNKTVQVENFTVDNDPADFKTIVKEIVRSANKVSLPDAEIVVSGGRGLQGPENWKILEDLADSLGAALACSKPVSDAGWRPHSEHVGQTGISVSPNLYIAIGISGAIQHLAGISAAKVIVAINNDAQAPIFKVADYGIVGDALTIVPQLTAAIKQKIVA